MNLSRPFHELLNRSEPALSGDAIRELQHDYQVILLKGFLGDLLPMRFDSYFCDQMRWMREHDIGYRRLEPGCGYGTQKISNNNVDAIANVVRELHEQQPAKQILIVSHSKGGIDALEMLLQYPELVDREIAGWIALQAPFQGTPVADWATRTRVLGLPLEWLLGGLCKGDKKVAASMTVDARNDYMRRNAQKIQELAKRLNILAFASSCTAGDPSLFRPLRFTIDRFAKIPNDGLLPIHGEVLRVDGIPCCPYVETEHLDHIYAVLPLLPDKPVGSPARHRIRRVRIFTALLKLWMDNRTPV